MINFYIVGEDAPSIEIIRKILREFPQEFCIFREDCKNGYGNIKKAIHKYNQAAEYIHYFILTDLDNDPCPSAKINDWLGEISKNDKLFFRIVVREIESWLLADKEGFSQFLNIPIANFVNNPDELNDPKNEVFRVVKKSNKRKYKEAILPNSGASIGPAYNSTIKEFIDNYWDLNRAMKNSPSLKKTIDALNRYKEEFNS
ncbi:DUF4276 family protein [Sulfurimonas sp. HSL-1716]|uniref:DUF4276 family protein n=1 Tax=Hydrocurvibacter sulfurireducens TaxID=3131937 RepID=UPI0031F8A001